jgi:hypothetical protein
MLESLVRKIATVNGIVGCIVVNPQDGTVLFKEGDISPALEDITAFFGSGFDVVASSLAVKGLRYSYMEKDDKKFIIVVREGGYIGCEIGASSTFEDVIGKILAEEPAAEAAEAPAEAKEKVAVAPPGETTQEDRFLHSKVRQINLLIDEFSEGGERQSWIDVVKEKLGEDETGQKILSCLSFEENRVNYNGAIGSSVREEDISSISKLVTDTLCRKAVGKFGAIEAKKKVHNVIEKLGIAR